MDENLIVPTVIRLGHSVYSHPNNYRLCFSRAEAIRILQLRGATRDDARRAVKQAMSREHGYETLRGDFSNVIEVVNDSKEYCHYKDGFGYDKYTESKKFWRSQPVLK